LETKRLIGYSNWAAYSCRSVLKRRGVEGGGLVRDLEIFSSNPRLHTARCNTSSGTVDPEGFFPSGSDRKRNGTGREVSFSYVRPYPACPNPNELACRSPLQLPTPVPAREITAIGGAPGLGALPPERNQYRRKLEYGGRAGSAIAGEVHARGPLPSHGPPSTSLFRLRGSPAARALMIIQQWIRGPHGGADQGVGRVVRPPIPLRGDRWDGGRAFKLSRSFRLTPTKCRLRSCGA